MDTTHFGIQKWNCTLDDKNLGTVRKGGKNVYPTKKIVMSISAKLLYDNKIFFPGSTSLILFFPGVDIYHGNYITTFFGHDHGSGPLAPNYFPSTISYKSKFPPLLAA